MERNRQVNVVVVEQMEESMCSLTKNWMEDKDHRYYFHADFYLNSMEAHSKVLDYYFVRDTLHQEKPINLIIYQHMDQTHSVLMSMSAQTSYYSSSSMVVLVVVVVMIE